MKKTRDKKKKLPQKPKSYRYTLYERAKSGQITAGIVFVAFFAFGLGLVFEKQYFPALMFLSLAGMIAYSAITEVKRLEIFEDTMFVKYLDSTITYKAEEVLSAEWISVEVVGKYSTPYFRKFTPELLIKTKSGKKIQLPPPGGYDIQKSILSWKEKYQTPNDDQSTSQGN